MPIIAASLYDIGLILDGTPPIGPDPRCSFGRIGSVILYLIPLLDRSDRLRPKCYSRAALAWAFSASAVCNLAVTLVYSLTLVSAHRQVSGDDLIRLIQLNVIAIAVFASLWQAISRFAGQAQSLAFLRTNWVLRSRETRCCSFPRRCGSACGLARGAT